MDNKIEQEVRNVLREEGEEKESMLDKGYDFIGEGQSANVYQKDGYAVKIGKWSEDRNRRNEVKDGEWISMIFDRVELHADRAPYVFGYVDYFVVMEYIDGRVGTELSKLEVAEIVRELKEVLYDWYGFGVELMDIHLDNVMVNREGNWKIIDWHEINEWHMGRSSFDVDEEFEEYWEDVYMFLEDYM